MITAVAGGALRRGNDRPWTDSLLRLTIWRQAMGSSLLAVQETMYAIFRLEIRTDRQSTFVWADLSVALFVCCCIITIINNSHTACVLSAFVRCVLLPFD